MAAPPDDRAGRIEHAVMVRRVLAGGNPIDEDFVRREAARSIDRSYDRDGVQRQLAAVMAAPSRREGLGALATPGLVIHGVDDPLVPAENGRRTAAALPGARLLEIEGMGHNLPESAWPAIFDAVEEVSAAAAPAA
jgi:pimeloyl-ACP methyl ester carboxylesterase